MFDIEIELTSDLSSVRTRVFHGGRLVRSYERGAPRSLLTDAVRYVSSGLALRLEVIFEETRIVWAPGAYQITLDAFRLVRAARARLAGGSTRTLIDVGCGSGVVGLNLIAALDGLEAITLLDLSESALRLAEQNFDGIDQVVHGAFVLSDYRSLERGQEFDVAVSNPPYFPSGSVIPRVGQVTMSDEFGLYGSLVDAVGVHAEKVIMTRSEAFASEIDAIIETRSDLVVSRLASWRAPLPAHLIAPQFLGRFDDLPSSAHEVEHEVSVLELCLKS